MKKGLLLFVALTLCALFIIGGIHSVFAVEFLGEEELYVSEPMDDDTYAGGALITFEDNIAGDLFVAGGSITVNGDVEGDLVIAGGQITVNGNVGDDLRAAGGSIFINGNVGDDVIATGGQLNVSSETLIGGSLIVGNGFANILGTVNEDIKGGGGKIVLGGTVYRDVDVQVQETLTLTEEASINGNLIYSSIREAELNEEQVSGYIEFNKQTIEEVDFSQKIEDFFSRWHLIFQLLKYLSVLLIALVLILLEPATMVRTADVCLKHPWKSLGLGFVIAICSIAAMIVLSVTVIGLALAGIMLGIFLITIYIAKVYAAVFIGRLILRPKKMTKGKLFGITALGGFIILVIGIVPFVGWLVSFLIIMTAFGAFWIHKKEMFDKLDVQKLS